MPHQIIDNRNTKLAQELNKQLDFADKAKFAVGYVYLSGLAAIQDKLRAVDNDGSYKIKELRLLIGNARTHKTIEEIAQKYRSDDGIAKEIDKQRYHSDTVLGKIERKKGIVRDALDDFRSSVSETDQTDTNESLIKLLGEMIKTQRLKIKVYTKSRLHAKAYILDFKNPQPNSKGIAIVGSSNISLAGFTNNTELNVYVHDNGENHDALTDWFNILWGEAEELSDDILTEIQSSWAEYEATPYDIYMKTLYTLVKDRLEGEDSSEILFDSKIIKDLADFQKEAVRSLVGIIKKYGGAFAADVVGVGKSYIGAAVIRQFRKSEGVEPLIICPKTLEKMWQSYDDNYNLNAVILPMSMLKEGDEDNWNFLLTDERYKNRDFVLIDESHNFRHSSPQRYKILQDFLHTGQKKALLMTATPRNKSARDVFNQIKLFHPNDITNIPINPPNLREYFKRIDSNDDNPEIAISLFRALLQHILVRRTRNYILRFYGYDSKTHSEVDPYNFDDYIKGKKRAYILVGGKHRYFPKRNIGTVSYSIENTYSGLYAKIRHCFGKAKFNYKGKPIIGQLTYARFALWHYVQKDRQKVKPYKDLHRAGINLRGLMRVMLFKRFESSVYAFRMTIERMLNIHQAFLTSLENGIVPAGEDAQNILYTADLYSEPELLDALQEAVQSKNYNIDDFDIERLKSHIEHDLYILQDIKDMVNETVIPPERDDKLQTLMKLLNNKTLKNRKALIFSESAETVKYLYDNINEDKKPEIQNASSGRENKDRLVKLFSPKANNYTLRKNDVEIRIMVSTDVLSEGLNLQDCDNLINYDLHWNPVKLIQRFGRIDRIGSEHDQIYGYNFLPETELDKNLNLHEIVHNRIQEIHDTIGEDAEILDNTEQLNPEAMYAIYKGESDKLDAFEDDSDYMDLNEAEELLRKLKADNLKEFDRISKLRDGIRAAQSSSIDNLYVFCQAGKKNKYNQLYLIDKKGEIVSQDISLVLGKIKAAQDTIGLPLPKNINTSIERIKKIFKDEAYSRIVEQRHSAHLTKAQHYVVRELHLLFKNSNNDDLKSEINLYDKIFRNIDRKAVKDELNKIKRNSLVGTALIRRLQDIYQRHNLQDLRDKSDVTEPLIVKVICSEVL
ncbi:MAG: helicase [candidate division Zixibacteria bacterium]|nr:helicase [candidate division Zixibacteria bacterium]